MKLKNVIKKIAVSAAAVMVLGTAGISASAASKEDVIGAARSAGFLEEYVQMLQNFLNTSHFSESQYDIMVDKLLTVGSEMDDFAMEHFGKTVAQMKGEGAPDDNTYLKDIAEKLDNKEIVSILDEIVDAGKQVGLDVTVDKKADKNFIITIKDKEGNIKMVTPIGKLVDRTGAEESEGNAAIPAVCAGVAAAGCIGAYAIIAKCSKTNKKMGKKNG